MEALDSIGLQLVYVRLEVLKPVAKECSVGRINPLNPVLKQEDANLLMLKMKQIDILAKALVET